MIDLMGTPIVARHKGGLGSGTGDTAKSRLAEAGAALLDLTANWGADIPSGPDVLSIPYQMSLSQGSGRRKRDHSALTMKLFHHGHLRCEIAIEGGHVPKDLPPTGHITFAMVMVAFAQQCVVSAASAPSPYFEKDAHCRYDFPQDITDAWEEVASLAPIIMERFKKRQVTLPIAHTTVTGTSALSPFETTVLFQSVGPTAVQFTNSDADADSLSVSGGIDMEAFHEADGIRIRLYPHSHFSIPAAIDPLNRLRQASAFATLRAAS